MVYKAWDKSEACGVVVAWEHPSLQTYKNSGFLIPSILSFPERTFAKDAKTQTAWKWRPFAYMGPLPL